MAERCPSRDHFERLLADALDAEEERALDQHLLGCRSCEETLEELTSWNPALLRRTGDESSTLGSVLLAGSERRHFSLLTSPEPFRRADEIVPPQIPGYQILSLLGRGGAGLVYKAYQESLSRVVALKVLPLGHSESGGHRDRFRREAESVARLQHPNIVQIFEVGEANGVAYLALEHVDGGTLAQLAARAWISPERGLDPRRAAAIVETLSHAMEICHRRGVIHRDLKPSNILMTSEGIPKLADFGLARLLQSEASPDATLDGNGVVGTPSYMAPEQARVGPGDMKSGPLVDVYGLGAILYALLSGRAPFEAESPIDTLMMVVNDDPVPLGTLRRRLPQDLETIAHKCLNKNPARRYVSAGDLGAELRRFLEGRPIHARPVGSVEIAWRWCRRKPALATASALAVSGLFAALAVLIGSNIAQRTLNESLEQSRQKLSRSLGEVSREKSRTQTLYSEMSLDRGLGEAAKGNVAEGLLWMAEALRILPDGEKALERVLRANLGAWSTRHPRVVTTVKQPNQFYSSALSRDGRFAITGGRDQESARIHNLQSGERVAPNSNLGNGPIALHPDGEVVAVFGHDSFVRQFRLDTGTRTGPEIGPIREPVHTLKYSPDGNLLACRTFDGTFRVYESSTGKLTSQHTITSEHYPGEKSPFGMLQIWWSLDGSSVLFPSGQVVRLSGEPHARQGFPPSLPNHLRAVSNDRTRAIRQLDSTLIEIIDLPDGKQVGKPIHLASVPNHVDFLPDGGSIAVSTGDGNLTLFDLGSGQASQVVWKGNYLTRTFSFSDDGRLMFFGGEGSASLLDLQGGEQSHAIVLPQESDVEALVISPDGRHVLSGTNGGVTRLWHVDSGRLASRTNRLARGSVSIGAFSSDNKWAIAAGGEFNRSGYAQLWDVEKGIPIGAELGHTNLVKSAAFSPDNAMLVTCGMDHTVRFWDVHNGAQAIEPSVITAGAAFALAFSPDGSVVVVGEESGDAIVIDARTHRVINRLRGHKGYVNAVAFAPDGKTCATGSWDGSARLWKVSDWTPVGAPLRHKLDLTGRVSDITFSHDSRLVATAAEDRSVRVWSVGTGESTGRPLVHPGRVLSAEFAPDARLLATAADDGFVRLWDVETGRPIGPPMGRSDQTRTVRFSPDGANLVFTDGRAVVIQKLPEPWLLPSSDVAQRVTQLTGLELNGDRNAIEAHEISIKKDTSEKPDITSLDAWHNGHANLALAQREWGAARWHLARLGSANEKDSWALFRQARALAGLGQNSEAKTRLQRALAQKSEQAVDAWIQSEAVACAASKDWESTLIFLDAWISLHPDDATAFALRARTRGELGRQEEASADAARVAELGLDAPGLLDLATIRLSAGDIARAEMLLERACQNEDESPVAWHYLLLCKLHRGDLEGYRKLAQSRVEYLRAHPTLRLDVANLILWGLTIGPNATSDWTVALDTAERMVRLMPESARGAMLNTQGGLLVRASRHQTGIEAIEAGIRLTGGDGGFEDHVFLAFGYHGLKRKDDAKAEQAKVRAAVEPANADHWAHLEREVLRRQVEAAVGK